MKKHLNFRPSLTETMFSIKSRKNEVPGFIVTAPHPISSRLWDVMSQVDDFGVFDRQRDNDTQISFWINPGYTIDTLRSLLVPATYIATIYDYRQFVPFWQIGIENHMTRYHSQIDFSGLIDPDLGRIIFSAWILSRGRAILDNSFRDNVSDKALYKDYVQDYLVAAYEAQNRLIFADKSNTALDAEEIAARLTMVGRLVTEMERDNDVYMQLVARSNTVKAEARVKWQELKAQMEDDAEANSELYALFTDTLSHFEATGVILDEISAKHDDNLPKKLLAEIDKLTPAKPPKK